MAGFLNLDGDDTVYADSVNVTISTADQGSSVYAYGSNNTIDAGAGSDVVYIIGSSGSGLYIIGGSGNDSILNGSRYGDKLSGMASVTIDAGSGDDYIHDCGSYYASINSGSGNDSIINNSSYATIDAGFADDSVEDYGYYAVIDLGSGDDSIYHGGAYSSLNAGDGNDFINYHGYYSSIYASDGDDTISNEGSYASINLGDGNDSIRNYGNYVSIEAGSGSDYIYNYGSNPSIDTGADNDTIDNRKPYASIDAGDGNNSIYSYGSYSKINAGSGNDKIETHGNCVSIDAGAGSDYIKNNSAYASIDAGSGDNTIENNSSYASIVAGNGNDTIETYGNHVSIDLGDGKDSIRSHGSYESIHVGSGDDFINILGDYATIDAGDGDDHIVNGGGDYASIDAGSGSDYIENANSGSYTTINAGDGNDTVVNHGRYLSIDAGSGSDDIYNTESYVTMNTGNDNDYVNNTGSFASIDAGSGDDTIRAYGGLDVSISMGAGSDLLIFDSGTNIVQDFTSEDLISIGNRTIENSIQSESGDDVIISFGTSNSITLQNVNINSITSADGFIFYGTTSGSGSDTTSGSFNLDGNDTIYADDTKVTILTTDFGSSVYAYGSNNTIDAGAGLDFISFSSRGSSLFAIGGIGDDSIYNYGSYVTIDSGSGNDTIENRIADYVFIDADSGENYIYSSGKYVSIKSGSGNDSIYIDDGDFSTVDAGAGNDFVRFNNYFSSDNISINAGSGDDTISAVLGRNATLSMGAGSDILNFYRGTDLILDFSPEDSISIGSRTIGSSIQSGSDVIISFGNSDSITLQNTYINDLTVHDSLITYGSNSGSGSDRGSGSGSFNLDGNDTIYADDINITIETTDFGSSIYAYNSDDIIDGGSGSDVISLNNSRSDLIQYTADNDSIYGFGSGDSISISSESGYEYFNGHFYKFYHDGMTWTDAGSFAENLGGYLVVITSAEEEAAIENWLENYGSKNSYWMGGYKDSTGSWNWVTGEDFNYTHWGYNQPDGDGSSAMMYYGSNYYSGSGDWNDFIDSGVNGQEFFGVENFGFIVEWDSAPAGANIITSGSQIGSDVVIELNGGSAQFLTIKDTNLENVSITGNNLITYVSGSESDTTGSGSDTGSGSNTDSETGPSVVIDIGSKISEAVGSNRVDDPRFHVYEENGQIYLSTVRSSQALGKVIVKGSSAVLDIDTDDEDRIMIFKESGSIESWNVSLGNGDDQLNIAAAGDYNGGSSADFFNITDSLESDITITGGTGSSGNIFYAEADTVSTGSDQNIITVTDANFNNGDILLIDAGIENLTKDFFDEGKFFNYATADQASTGTAKNVFDASELIDDLGMDFSMMKVANRSDVDLSNGNSVGSSTNIIWVNDSKTIIDLDQTDDILLFANTNDVGDFISFSGDYNDTIHVGMNDTIDSGGGNDLLIGWNSSNMLILDKFNSAQLDNDDLIIDGSVTITNIDLSTDVFANVDGVYINIMDSLDNIGSDVMALVATDL